MDLLFAFGMPGVQDWIVIGIIALLLFGPKKLPEIARTLGKTMNEFQKAKEEFTNELHRSVRETEARPAGAPMAALPEISNLPPATPANSSTIGTGFSTDPVATPPGELGQKPHPDQA